jgi:ribosomal protein S12 methylthiotransferase accessory factor
VKRQDLEHVVDDIYGQTRRTVAPETTFERIQKYLECFGVTRLADITGLDCLGVPVYVAVRPRGRVLQSSQGKGQRPIDAKVSALMESIELGHAEYPLHEFVYASTRSLEATGRGPVAPAILPGFCGASTWSPANKLLWVAGEELITKSACMVPASAVYYVAPSLYALTTTGLASGNTELEATLHALYEIYERDTTSELVDGEDVSFDLCDVVEPSSITAPVLKAHVERITGAGIQIRLFRVGIDSVIHTFCAALLDRVPFAHSSHVNVGFGSHLSPTSAASRALTEAAQSRLTHIHASREDLDQGSYLERHDNLYRFCLEYRPDTQWRTLHDHSTPTLSGDFEAVMRQFQDEGATQVFRHVLSATGQDIAVVKVLIPGTRNDLSS